MSEVCCEVPAVAEAEGKKKGAAECDAGSAAARRRRMEIRRLRLAAERDGAAEETSRKRRKVVVEVEEEASTDEETSVEVEPARYGVTSVCGRRRDMEDAVSIQPDLLPGHHFFGVFDGHGCSHVSTCLPANNSSAPTCSHARMCSSRLVLTLYYRGY
jgi:protein phosphatase 2C